MIDSLLRGLDAARERAACRRPRARAGCVRARHAPPPALVDDVDLLGRTLAALGEVAAALPVVFPAHPRTTRRIGDFGLDVPRGCAWSTPLPYLDFVSLEQAAAAVATDSGGVQEETTVLGVPCFTLRDNTERPVTVTHGTNSCSASSPSASPTFPACSGGVAPAAGPAAALGWAGGRARGPRDRAFPQRSAVTSSSTRSSRSACAERSRVARELAAATPHRAPPRRDAPRASGPPRRARSGSSGATDDARRPSARGCAPTRRAAARMTGRPAAMKSIIFDGTKSREGRDAPRAARAARRSRRGRGGISSSGTCGWKTTFVEARARRSTRCSFIGPSPTNANASRRRACSPRRAR